MACMVFSNLQAFSVFLHLVVLSRYSPAFLNPAHKKSPVIDQALDTNPALPDKHKRII